MKKILALIVLLLILLFVTNPNQSDYSSWVNNNFGDKFNYSTKDSVGKLITSISEKVINMNTKRQNFYLFSIYETKLGEVEISRTLGICKFFIKI